MLTNAHTRSPRPRSLRPRSGFTLVEILMVVVILGIASAIIIPQVGTRDDMRVAAAGRTLIADLIFAQNQAITTGRKVFVRFDVAANRYSLCSAVATGGDTLLIHPLSQSSYIQQFGTASRGWEAVKIASADFDGVDALYPNEFTLAFDEIGSPYVYCYDYDATDDLSAGSIVLQAGQFTNTITISPATGEISISVP